MNRYGEDMQLPIPRTEVYRVAGHERVRLFCGYGHDTGLSAPTTSATARRLLAGDFSGEFCGLTSCDWEVSA